MTDLEALHWLRRMKATVLFADDDGCVCVIVPFGPREVVTGNYSGKSIEVSHRDSFAEVTATTLPDATWQALQMWRAKRGAVDGLADLRTVPPECSSVTSGICTYCGQPTVEHTEFSPDAFKLMRAILCTACGAKTFLDLEKVTDVKSVGGFLDG